MCHKLLFNSAKVLKLKSLAPKVNSFCLESDWAALCFLKLFGAGCWIPDAGLAKKKQLPGFQTIAINVCWVTRTRTLNNRTKICCVTDYTMTQTCFKSGCKIMSIFLSGKACSKKK